MQLIMEMLEKKYVGNLSGKEWCVGFLEGVGWGLLMSVVWNRWGGVDNKCCLEWGGDC